MKKLILAAIIVAAVAMKTSTAKAGFSASFVDPLTHLSVSIGDHGYRAPAPAPVVYAPAPPVCYTPAPVVYRTPVYYGGPRYVYHDYGHRDFDGYRGRFDRDDHRGWGGDRDDHRGDRNDSRGGNHDDHGGYRH